MFQLCFYSQDTLWCLSAISGHLVNIVGPESFSGVFSIEGIPDICVQLDVCKCVVEPICRPDEYGRKEKVFN